MRRLLDDGDISSIEGMVTSTDDVTICRPKIILTDFNCFLRMNHTVETDIGAITDLNIASFAGNDCISGDDDVITDGYPRVIFTFTIQNNEIIDDAI